MYGGLSKLGTALALVIAVFLLVGLVGQILYILCRRRRKLLSDVDDESSVVVLPSDYSTAAPSSRSSGHGFFSFWRNQSRIEPQEAHRRHEAQPTVTVTVTTDQSELQELEDIIKWQALYGSSRLLFTIEEGEREGLDSETTYSSCAEKEVVKTTTTTTTTKVYLEERCRGAADVAVTVVSIAVDDDQLEAFTTPLETPCASPLYYTPLVSPSRE